MERGREWELNPPCSRNNLAGLAAADNQRFVLSAGQSSRVSSIIPRSPFIGTNLTDEPKTSISKTRHIVTDLAVDIRVALPRHFSELAVFDARLYIRVRRIDKPS